jgi:hypothetical protein
MRYYGVSDRYCIGKKPAFGCNNLRSRLQSGKCDNVIYTVKRAIKTMRDVFCNFICSACGDSCALWGILFPHLCGFYEKKQISLFGK